MRDVIVVGAGPAGMSTAIFAASEGLDVLVIADQIGGQAGTSALVENYLGFPVGVSGQELAADAAIQAQRFGVEIVQNTVNQLYAGIESSDGILVQPTFDKDIRARTVVLATGVKYREIEHLPASEFVSYGTGTMSHEVGAGDYYLVVGGGNSAAQAAVDLAEKGAYKVTLLSRNLLNLGASAYMVDKVRHLPNIELIEGKYITKSTVTGSGVCIEVNGEYAEFGCYDRVFAYVGGSPNAHAGFGVRTSHTMHILTGPDVPVPAGIRVDPFETSTHNVFAVGDVRFGSIPRIAAAVGEGAAVVPTLWKRVRG